MTLAAVLYRDAELAERLAAGSTSESEKVFLTAFAEELRAEAQRLEREAGEPSG